VKLQRVALVAALALTIVPVTASADDRDDMLALAQRIAGRYGQATVTLHAVPPGFPASVPLPRASLLGSVGAKGATANGGPPAGSRGIPIVVGGPRGQDAFSATLYYTATDRTATLNSYEAALAAAGWHKPTGLLARMNVPQGGFAATPPAFNAWCPPAALSDAVLVIGQSPSDDPVGFEVDLAAGGGGAAMFCSDAPLPLPVPIPVPAAPLPTFSPPPGVTFTASGPATDGSTTGARITSTLGIDAIFDAFARQVLAGGWSAGPRSSAPGLRSLTFTKTVDGVPYTALLSIYALDATHYTALADVSNH